MALGVGVGRGEAGAALFEGPGVAGGEAGTFLGGDAGVALEALEPFGVVGGGLVPRVIAVMLVSTRVESEAVKE